MPAERGARPCRPPRVSHCALCRTGLREKIEELETFKDILAHQVDTMQNYFDACISVTDSGRAHAAGEQGTGSRDELHDRQCRAHACGRLSTRGFRMPVSLYPSYKVCMQLIGINIFFS